MTVLDAAVGTAKSMRALSRIVSWLFSSLMFGELFAVALVLACLAAREYGIRAAGEIAIGYFILVLLAFIADRLVPAADDD
jgi:hypothetical protein